MSEADRLRAVLQAWLPLPKRGELRDLFGPELGIAVFVGLAGPLLDLLPWSWALLVSFGAAGLFIALRFMRRRRPRLMWRPTLDAATAAAFQLGPTVEIVHLDGAGIHDAASLAEALDKALGAFVYPEEPLAHALAHVGYELRGSGAKVLLWTDARNLVANDPATFGAFVTAWKPGPPPTPECGRLLVIDLPDPAGDVAEAA